MSRRTGGAAWIAAAIIVIIVALAAWVYYARQHTISFPHAHETAASSKPLPIQHPISDASVPASASTAPLPLLNASDAPVLQELLALPGADGLRDLLLTQAIIPHFVATIDALPRHTIGTGIIPLHTPAGAFIATQADGKYAIDEANYARYDVYMTIVDAVDTQALATWYVRDYPLFQQAWRELGYPTGYFNDRLIEAIDDMLAAPNASQPVELLPMPTPDGHYVYADLTWESLSVGQKLMIRIGPEHEAQLKAKLREIRAALLGKLPKQ